MARCQDIWRRILAKSSATNCGGDPSDSSSSESENESEDETQFSDANDTFDTAPADSLLALFQLVGIGTERKKVSKTLGSSKVDF